MSHAIPIMEVPPYILVKQAKELFGFGEKKTWKLIAQKKIVASKDGKDWRIWSPSIFKYLEKYENK